MRLILRRKTKIDMENEIDVKRKEDNECYNRRSLTEKVRSKPWAQFRNCAKHNEWNREQELIYLKSSLYKEVANVLWDYGVEITESLSGLTKVVQKRFGGKSFVDKHRIEIRSRRRQKNETL